MSDDPYNLERFVRAQDPVYKTVTEELASCRKVTHWMWFVFPILEGLGGTQTAKSYAISGLDEARAYWAHPVLGPRLRECVELALPCDKTALEIFGETDEWKFKQCLTLFLLATEIPLFSAGLEKFFDGKKAGHTLKRLEEMGDGDS